MKSMNIRKVGSILAGTAVLGAALSAPVMASMDNTGITKGFFYDANYNPVAQIVVGEKGMASDAVAAGNIAATIGNLAYMTKTVTPSGSGATAEGQVVITTAARGAVGDFVQDVYASDQTLSYFYDADDGFTFSYGVSGVKTYEQGDFTSYTLSCDKQTRNEAGVLMTGSYKNIHCLFCHNLCLESLENPSHDMKEQISVDSSKITYYEDGLGNDDSEALKMAIDKEAITYTVTTDYIPMKTITNGETGDDKYLDFEYRGKMILFGEEYYVKDIDGSSKVYLAKGKVLDDVTSEGFTSEYNGYKFKVDHLIYAAEYQVAGILIDVQKPDGTIVQTQISKMANGVVDNIEVAGVYAEEAAALQSASLIVYDLNTQVLLEDSEDLQLGGKTYEDWEVTINTIGHCADDSDCDITEYDLMAEDDPALLKNITITYKHALDGDEALGKDESLAFPNKFKMTFKGYLDNDYNEIACSGAGDDNILLERGDENYQMVITLTGDDSNKYSRVRLDNGPFARNDLFIAGGKIFKFVSYTVNSDDNTVDVKVKPEIRGSMVELNDMMLLCSDEEESATGEACGEDITFRQIALVQALEGGVGSDWDMDEEYAVDPEEVYIKEDVTQFGGTTDVLYADGNLIIVPTGFADLNLNTTQPLLVVNGSLVGEFSDFKVDGYNLYMNVYTTGTDGAAGDYLDYNSDVNFTTADGDVAIDMYDRSITSDDSDDFENSLVFADETLSDDSDSMLIVPEGGDTFTIEWGSSAKIEAVDICHPMEEVDSTYFIGTAEEETVAESTITKADEGKEITAGCCTFTVDSFDVSVSNASTDTVTTATVNAIVGSVVVPESAADATKNLIIVGGPAVNAMTTVTADQISAQTDKYIVKKDGNKLIVAGWTADDTVAAGNSLIAWLKANAH
jgi:hypothetical protein